MEFSSILILTALYVGAFVTWSTEASGSIIRLFGMETNSNLISTSVVQSISIFSRLGFFLQALALAWIVDEGLFIKFRPEMAIGYLLISLFSLLFINNFANKIIQLFLNIIRFKIKTQPWEINSVQIKFNSKTTPKPLQVLGYVLLYVGGFFPILIQLALPEYAARGVALSSIVNGISTVILISYYDLKTSIEINKTGNSSIPSQLIWARYAALVLLLTVCSIIYFTIAGV